MARYCGIQSHFRIVPWHVSQSDCAKWILPTSTKSVPLMSALPLMLLTRFSIQFVKRILLLSHPPTRKPIYSSRSFVSHPSVTSSSYVKCSRYSVISYLYMIPQRLFLYCLSNSGYYWRRNPWSIICRLWIIYDSFCFVLASFCELIGMVWCGEHICCWLLAHLALLVVL